LIGAQKIEFSVVVEGTEKDFSTELNFTSQVPISILRPARIYDEAISAFSLSKFLEEKSAQCAFPFHPIKGVSGLSNCSFIPFESTRKIKLAGINNKAASGNRSGFFLPLFCNYFAASRQGAVFSIPLKASGFLPKSRHDPHQDAARGNASIWWGERPREPEFT
jgi:hypothetical protein